MGRGAACVRHAERRHGGAGERGGYYRLLPRKYGALQMPALCQLRAVAQDLDRQNPEIRFARDGKNQCRSAMNQAFRLLTPAHGWRFAAAISLAWRWMRLWMRPTPRCSAAAG